MASSTSFLSPPSLSSSPSLFFLSPPCHRPHHKLRLHKNHPFPLSSLSLSSRTKKVAVFIAPVEQAPSPDFDFTEEISRLDSLRSKLRSAKSLDEKVRALDSDARVWDFMKLRKGWVARVLGGLGRSDALLIKSLVAAGQEHVLGAEAEGGGGRAEVSGLKSAMYVLGDMVEMWSLSGNGAGVGRERGGGEEMRQLLMVLGEVEQFYDCIGGIIG